MSASRKTDEALGPFRIERYDSAWGGWRAVPKAYNDDSANEFPTKRAAMAARRDLERRSTYAYRVVPVPHLLTPPTSGHSDD